MRRLPIPKPSMRPRPGILFVYKKDFALTFLWVLSETICLLAFCVLIWLGCINVTAVCTLEQPCPGVVYSVDQMIKKIIEEVALACSFLSEREAMERSVGVGGEGGRG